jgi:hypothetical protein
MSRQKNISGGPLDVPILGRAVDDGEIVDVPDFQPAHNEKSEPGDPDHLPIVWPENRWQPVKAKAAAKADTATPDDTSGKAAG